MSRRPAGRPALGGRFRIALIGLATLLGTCALINLAHATAALGPIGDAHFESVDSENVIVDGVVTALAQDRNGFLWIGSQEGLLRFDGYHMLRFRHDPEDPQSLGADFIRDLLPTADGGLWVATGTGGLSRFDPTNGRFRRFRHDPDDPHSLGHDGVLAITAADADGESVWLGLAGAGVDRFDPASGRFEHIRNDAADDNSIRHDTVRSLLRDRRGDLWIGTRRGLSRRFADGRIESTAAGIAALDEQYIYALFESSDGRIWVGTQGQGGGWIDPDSGQWHALPLGVESDGLAHPWVTDIAEPLPGQIWIATYGSGIDVLDADGKRVMRRIVRDPAVASSLAVDSVTCLLSDRSGLLWVGSWGGGLQRHNPVANAFHALHYSPTRPHTLSNPSVLSALDRPDGTIWLGTDGNGIDILDRQRGVVDGHRPDPLRPGALPAGAITALLEDNQGTVWVGTRQSGLLRFDPTANRFEPGTRSTGSADLRINMLRRRRDGGLWIVTESGLAQFDTASGQSVALRMDDGSEFSLPVLAIAEEKDGRLWVGTARGLLLLPTDAAGLHWVAAGLPATGLPAAGLPATGLSATGLPATGLPVTGLPKGITRLGAVQALVFDPGDTLWLASGGRLLRAASPRADRLQLQSLDLREPLPSQTSWSELQSDQRGRLWTGNLMIDPAVARAWPFGRAEGADVGARTEGMPSKTSDGLLLFGGTRGLLIIEPEAFAPWTFEPTVVTTQISIDGLPRPWSAPDSGLLLSPSSHRFSVEFAALDLSAPQQNRYRYRLQGLDDDWILTDAEHRVATYSNLWPGSYQLRLSASNRYGDWSPQELQLTVEVQPAFWQTPAFVLLLVIGLASLVYLGFLARTMRIRRRSRELAELVELRTAELSTAHRKLLQTQHRLAAQEREAALGGLVAGVAHEVSTPLGVVMTALSGIADGWRELAKGLGSGQLQRSDLDRLRNDGEEYTELALRNSDRVAELVANLKAIVARRDSDRVEDVDLSLHLREACALVSADLRDLGCRIEVEVEQGLHLVTVPDALTEVLTRVLRNCVDHAFAGNSIGWVRISAQRQPSGGVEIDIVDNGRGISDEALGQVFDPFFTSRRGRDGHVGLGLYVAHTHTAQRLRGSISVRSNSGEGTQVRILLPDLANHAGQP